MFYTLFLVLLLLLFLENTQLTEDDVSTYIQQLTGRHYRRIEGVIRSRQRTLNKTMEEIVNENLEFLFDARQMFWDWIQDRDCTYEEIRATLREAFEEVRGRSVDGKQSTRGERFNVILIS